MESDSKGGFLFQKFLGDQKELLKNESTNFGVAVLEKSMLHKNVSFCRIITFDGEVNLKKHFAETFFFFTALYLT